MDARHLTLDSFSIATRPDGHAALTLEGVDGELVFVVCNGVQLLEISLALANSSIECMNRQAEMLGADDEEDDD